VADRFDACPETAGLASTDRAMHGCPLSAGDPDKDGLRGKDDACPFESGPDTPDDLASRGCPKHVRVTDKAVVLLSPIRFDIEKATIRLESMAVIDDCARVLGEHPEILQVEIQGHDNHKRDHYGMNLSQRRADSVLKALVSKGVDPSRLQAKGYGMSVPLAMPDTEEGKRLNLRVELVIRQRRSP
jgi:OmpA-OmpF porin, OOP family